MGGTMSPRSIGCNELLRVARSEADDTSRGTACPRSQTSIPLFSEPSVANPVDSEGQPISTALKARPNTRFRRLLIEKIFYSHGCDLKCYQNGDVLGKVSFGRSRPTGSTRGYL